MMKARPVDICLLMGDGWPEWISVNRLLPILCDRGLQTLVVLLRPSALRKPLPINLANAIRAEAFSLWDVIVPELDALDASDVDPKSCTGPRLWQDRYGAEFLQLNAPAHEALISTMTRFRPRLGVSLRPYTVFRPNLIEHFQREAALGLWNLHTARLPEFRGVKPLFRVMECGHGENVLTLHHVAEGLDTGDIISELRVPIDYSRSLFGNYVSYGPAMADLVAQEVTHAFAGKAPVHLPQDNVNACYYSYPSDTEIDRFAQRGLSLLAPGDIHSALRGCIRIRDAEKDLSLVNRVTSSLSSHGLGVFA